MKKYIFCIIILMIVANSLTAITKKRALKLFTDGIIAGKKLTVNLTLDSLQKDDTLNNDAEKYWYLVGIYYGRLYKTALIIQTAQRNGKLLTDVEMFAVLKKVIMTIYELKLDEQFGYTTIASIWKLYIKDLALTKNFVSKFPSSDAMVILWSELFTKLYERHLKSNIDDKTNLFVAIARVVIAHLSYKLFLEEL